MGVLYKLTFPNDKVYIGMSTVSLLSRIHTHRNRAKADKPKLIVHRAWKLYGEPLIETLAVVENDDLPATEIRAIKVFNSFGAGGYNLTPGGETSPMKVPSVVEKVRALALTPERIARNIEVHLGSKRSAETCKLISETLKGVGLGIPKSVEHRKKLSDANKGKSFIIGRKLSDKTKRQMSESAKKFWQERKLNGYGNHEWYWSGRKHSEETKAKLSAIAKARSAKNKANNE